MQIITNHLGVIVGLIPEQLKVQGDHGPSSIQLVTGGGRQLVKADLPPEYGTMSFGEFRLKFVVDLKTGLVKPRQ